MKVRLKKKILRQTPYLAKAAGIYDLPQETLAKYFPNGPPFKPGELVLVLGEISNMKGHIVLVHRDGTVLWGYDVCDFKRVVNA